MNDMNLVLLRDHDVNTNYVAFIMATNHLFISLVFDDKSYTSYVPIKGCMLQEETYNHSFFILNLEILQGLVSVYSKKKKKE